MTRDVIRRLSRLCTLALCAGVFLCVVIGGAAVRPLLGGASAVLRRLVDTSPRFRETPTAVASGRSARHAPLTKRIWRRSTSWRTMRTLMPRALTFASPALLVGLAATDAHDTSIPHKPPVPLVARHRGSHAATRAPPKLA